VTEAVPHLDLDALADALAGEAGTDGAAHLARCADCTSRLAELQAAETGILAALAALPDPPLPDGLADRLSAALAAEPPLVQERETRRSVTALPQRAPRRRLLPAAAAAVLLVSGAGLGYALVQGGAGDDTADTASESSAGGTALPVSSSGTDYGDAGAVTAALPAVLSGTAAGTAGTAMDSAAGSTQAQTEGEAPSDPSRTAQLPAPAVAAAPPDPLARLRTPEGLDDCLAGVLPPEEPDLQPVALDYAQYQGAPALAIVLPDPDPGTLSVYVVGPQCSQADAQVLTFLRVDRP
jgi:hypothetical protein